MLVRETSVSGNSDQKNLTLGSSTHDCIYVSKRPNVISLAPAAFPRLPEQAVLQFIASPFFPTRLLAPSFNHSPCATERCNLFPYTQNVFRDKILSDTLPHTCPRGWPTSTSRERLVRSVHSRQMLLGPACEL